MRLAAELQLRTFQRQVLREIFSRAKGGAFIFCAAVGLFGRDAWMFLFALMGLVADSYMSARLSRMDRLILRKRYRVSYLRAKVHALRPRGGPVVRTEVAQ